MRLSLLIVASLFAIAGCTTKSNPPSEAPTGVTAAAGDGVVLMSWDMLPDLIYWIFYSPGTSVAPGEVGSIAIKNAASPRAVTGLLNGTQYAFVMNATQKDSAAGPNSLVVPATPRLAGDSWLKGALQGPENLNALAFSGARYVAVGDGTTIFAGDFNYGHTNPVGVTVWMPPNPFPPGFLADDFKAVIFNGAYVVLGANGAVTTSFDGVNWTVQAAIPGASGLNGIAFGVIQGNSTYIAVGNGGQIYTTGDLTHWTLDTSAGTTADLTSIAVLNQGFFVTGSNGTLLQNPGDGTGWHSVLTGGVTSTLRAAAFMPSAPLMPGSIRYVAVGDGGTILTSTDDTVATAWTPVSPAPLTQNLLGVTVGGATGTRFLAVGQGGAVVFGDSVISNLPVVNIQWTTASQPPVGDFSSVHFFTGQYLAVGAAGVNAVSH